MEYKLNSFKTFKDNGILVVCGMFIAIFGMLLPMTWWASYQWEEKAESETETAWTAELREPWQLIEDEDGLHQEMPPISEEISDSHERFKEIAYAYNLDPSMFWTVENHYWIKEGVILCITIAETSGGWRWYGKTNPWNVGNNDRWNRVKYAFFETWLEKIGQTLTNQYLWRIQTLWCLSNAGSCQSRDDNGKRYATSDWNWQRNMSACLWTIYWKIDPATFNIRR